MWKRMREERDSIVCRAGVDMRECDIAVWTSRYVGTGGVTHVKVVLD